MNSTVNKSSVDLDPMLSNLAAASDQTPETLHEYQPVKNVVMIVLSITGLTGEAANVLRKLAEKIDSAFAKISKAFIAQKETISNQEKIISKLSESLAAQEEKPEKKQLDLERELSEAEQSVKNLEEKFKETEERLKQTEVNYEFLEKTKYLQSRSNTEEREKNKIEREKMTEELSLVSEELNSQKALYDKLSAENKKNKEEIEQLSITNRSQFLQLHLKEKRISVLTGFVDSSHDEKMKTGKQLEACRAQLKDKKAELQEVKSSQAALKNENESLVLTVASKVEAINSIEGSCSELQTEIKSLTAEISSDKEANGAIAREVESLKEQLSKVEKEREEAKVGYSKATSELANNSLELRKLSKNQEQLSKELDQSQEKLDLSEADRRGLGFEVQHLESTVEDLKLKNETLQKANALFEETITRQAEENQRLQREVNELKFQQKDAQVHAERKLQLDHEALRDIKSNRRTVVEHQEKELELKKAYFEQLFEKSQSEVKNELKHIEFLRGEHVNLKKAIKNEREVMQSKQQESLEKIEMANSRIKELDIVRSTLNVRSEISQRLILQGQVRLVRTEQKKVQLTDRIRQIEIQIAMDECNLSNLVEKIARETKAVGSSDDDKVQEVITTKEVVEKFKSLLQNLKKEVQKIEASENSLHEQINLLQSEEDESRFNLEREIKDLLELKLFHKERIEQLEKNLKALAKKLSETKEKINRLGEEHEEISQEAESIREKRVLSERVLRGDEATLNANKWKLPESGPSAAMERRKSPFQFLVSSITG
jgi:chromosome segregation ATPase